MEKCKVCEEELENTDALREHVESEHSDVTTWEEYQKKHVPVSLGKHIGIGKKWYMIGIGGAGCNIVDAIAMRISQLKETFMTQGDTHGHENNKVFSYQIGADTLEIWESGLVEDYVMLDTNIAGPLNTFIAKELKKWDASAIIANCIIAAHLEHGYTGVGFNWAQAKKWMEEEVKEKAIESKIDRYAIGRAQGVMVLHSVTKGTGCGATPELVRYLREQVLTGKDRPIFSVTVLPSRPELKMGTPKINGTIGLARIAKVCDAVILFDNSSLDRNKNNSNVNIANIEKYNSQYGELNNPLVAFLEGFVITKGIFDIRDSFEPAKLKLSKENPMAIICAPVHGKHIGSDFGSGRDEKEGYLEDLLINTIINGRLVNCDRRTAIGGSFVFHVPDEKAGKQVKEIIDNGIFHDIIRDKRFLNDQGGDEKDIHVYHPIIIPSINNIYLWGILWNPKIETLEEMYNYTEKHKSRIKEEVWNDVENIASNLGGKK